MKRENKLAPIAYTAYRVMFYTALEQYQPDECRLIHVCMVFEFLATVKPCSRIVFTYIVKDFIDGENTYGLGRLYQQTRIKEQLWRFGMQPSQVPRFLGKYGWKEIEQVGADEYLQHYLIPLGRTDAVMEIEKTIYAENAVT